jgi:hypothetical protein
MEEMPKMLKNPLSLFLLAAALLAGVAPAHASGDIVQFGSDIHVARQASVHDAVCFFCNATIDGEVQGNLVVFFGTVRLSGNADRDVVNFFGEVAAEDNTSIGNNLVSFFSVVHMGENVSVGHDMVVMIGTVHAPASLSVGHNRVVQPGFIVFAPLAILGLALALIVRQAVLARRRQAMRGYPLPPGV